MAHDCSLSVGFLPAPGDVCAGREAAALRPRSHHVTRAFGGPG